MKITRRDRPRSGCRASGSPPRSASRRSPGGTSPRTRRAPARAPARSRRQAAASMRRRRRVLELDCGHGVGSIWTGGAGAAGHRPLEGGRALLQERLHALQEVAGRRGLAAGSSPRARAARPCRANSHALSWRLTPAYARGRAGRPAAAASSSTAPSNSSSAATRLIRPHSSAWRGADPLAEHRHLGRAREADPLRARAATSRRPGPDRC